MFHIIYHANVSSTRLGDSFFCILHSTYSVYVTLRSTVRLYEQPWDVLLYIIYLYCRDHTNCHKCHYPVAGSYTRFESNQQSKIPAQVLTFLIATGQRPDGEVTVLPGTGYPLKFCLSCDGAAMPAHCIVKYYQTYPMNAIYHAISCKRRFVGSFPIHVFQERAESRNHGIDNVPCVRCTTSTSCLSCLSTEINDKVAC